MYCYQQMVEPVIFSHETTKLNPLHLLVILTFSPHHMSSSHTSQSHPPFPSLRVAVREYCHHSHTDHMIPQEFQTVQQIHWFLIPIMKVVYPQLGGYYKWVTLEFGCTHLTLCALIETKHFGCRMYIPIFNP